MIPTQVYFSSLKHVNMAKQYASIQDFAYRYFSLPQTALVDNMLYEDKHMDMLNSLYNFHMHTVKLSTGTFIGTHSQLMDKKVAIRKQLQKKRSKALQKDINLLECDIGKERTVCEWYAVPYWIARHMIEANEVVLSWKGCYWWGKCAIGDLVESAPYIQELYHRISRL